MKKSISDYTNPDELRNLMQNATRLGNQEIARAAFARICELEGSKHIDPLERQFYAMLQAYEELLTEKNGKRTLAARTRQKLKNHPDVRDCLEDWALSSQSTDGFRLLIDRGQPELTGEYIVITNADRFSPEAVERARNRLIEAGVALR